MAYDWQQFSEKQLNSILQSDARINLWQGAVRSGKTIASIVRWLEFIQNGPEGNLLMIGKTHRTLQRNILDEIEKIVGPQNYSFNRGLGVVKICGRKIYIAGANDKRAEDKIRGMTLAGAYGDEVSIWPEGFFNMLLSRLSVEDAKLFVTTNPEGSYHWLKTDFIDRKQELDFKDFHFVIEDNLTLSKNYIEQLKKEYTGVWYKRYIQGLWVLAEGMIYDNFDEDIHVVDEAPDKFDSVHIGVDYGDQNPTVFLLLGRKDGKLYLIDEYYHGNKEKQRIKDIDEYVENFIDFIDRGMPIDNIIVDPAAKTFINLLRNDGRVRINIKKAKNDVLPGIRTVASRISREQLFVHSRCSNTRKEFASYVWDEKAQQRGEDKPLKENDHAMDGLRYIIYTMYPIRGKHRVARKPIGF